MGGGCRKNAGETIREWGVVHHCNSEKGCPHSSHVAKGPGKGRACAGVGWDPMPRSQGEPGEQWQGPAYLWHSRTCQLPASKVALGNPHLLATLYFLCLLEGQQKGRMIFPLCFFLLEAPLCPGNVPSHPAFSGESPGSSPSLLVSVPAHMQQHLTPS